MIYCNSYDCQNNQNGICTDEVAIEFNSDGVIQRFSCIFVQKKLS